MEHEELAVGGPMTFILSYWSQDHLETFFFAARSSYGKNDSPSVQKFKSSFKRLLLENEVKAVGGNCNPQGQTQLMAVCLPKACALPSEDPAFEDPDSLELSSFPNMSDQFSVIESLSMSKFKLSAISYISGYFVRMV